MSQFLPFIISGIATGAIYGLTAAGLTLTYKTSGILNFGQGALATAGAYLFYFLHINLGWDWKVALFVSVLIAGPIMGLLMERLARQLSVQRTEWKIVGTVGLVLLMEGVGSVAYGTNTLPVPQYLPRPNQLFRLGGVNVLYPELWVTITAVVLVTLYILFRISRAGIEMRAVVDDPDLVSLQGTSASRVRRRSWIISSTLAALSGVLILPFIGLNPIAFTLLAVATFGASAVGMFSSILLSFVGAILIEIGASISTKYTVTVPWTAGLPNAFPLIILLVALLVAPSWRLSSLSSVLARQRIQWRAPVRIRVAVGVVVLGLLAVVPTIVGPVKLGFYTTGLTDMILMLSLGLLVKGSGQVSLCQVTFAAIGAVTFSQLTVGHGWPWIPALVASLVAVPVGILVAIPAIRLSGVFFALSTLGFGVLVTELLYSQNFMFTTSFNGLAIPRPSFASGNTQYYYLVLVVVLVVAAAMLLIDRSRLGRMLRGMAETPGMVSVGLNTTVARMLVFSISAALAAVAGILYAASLHFATGSDSYFGFLNSLTLLGLLALAPFAVPWYALFGLVDAVIPGYVSSPSAANWLNALFGLLAVSVALQGGSPSMPVRVQRFFDGLGSLRGRQALAEVAVPVDVVSLRSAPWTRTAFATPPRSEDMAAKPGLEVEELVVKFGGLVAVRGVSFQAPVGRLTGIIGPNGAGKTSTFDACSGLNRRVGGSVRLHGEVVTRKNAAARARLGLGRTFQRMQLSDSLTVAENVSLGHEAGLAGAHVLSQLASSPAVARANRLATSTAIEQCGIDHLAHFQVGTLSTGQRRLVELARCLAGSFDVLMLDEPSSGLDREETEELGSVLQKVVTEMGRGILLVEHDMSLVMNVCSYIYVLDYGTLIFEGDPISISSSEIVKAAYLGIADPSEIR